MSYNRFETERLLRETRDFIRYLDGLEREGDRILESIKALGIEIHHREPEEGKDIFEQTDAFVARLRREGAI